MLDFESKRPFLHRHNESMIFQSYKGPGSRRNGDNNENRRVPNRKCDAAVVGARATVPAGQLQVDAAGDGIKITPRLGLHHRVIDAHMPLRKVTAALLATPGGTH